MASIDVESLLNPVSEARPSGQNLEYDPAFAGLERAVAGKPEQQMGDVIVPSEPPDWEVVEREAAALLVRTKDLRLAVHLARALLHRRSFPGLAEGLGAVRGSSETFWATVHPELDKDDNDDPTSRVNALLGLADAGFVLGVRLAPLVRSRAFGPISIRDVDAANGAAPALDERKLDMAAVDGAFQDVELAELEATLGAVKAAQAHVAALDAAFDAAGAQGPDLSGLLAALREASGIVSPRLERRRPIAESADGGSAGDGPSGQPSAGAFRGEVRSREDVLRAIDQICGYYARHEPSSPLPLLLQRCKRLVSMSFIDIVKDLTPDALATLELILGKRDEET